MKVKLPEPKDFSFILSVNKPEGKTSFAVVSYVKKLSGIKKVGHSGTLDPFASGVLLIVMGKATKQVERLMNLEKEYITTVRFGVATDTYDYTGKVLEEFSTKDLSEQGIKNALTRFEGDIEQVPPIFSALKYKGKPLYKYARKGEHVTLNARSVKISGITLESFKSPEAIIRIVCSRGTYIRSIAHDLGKFLGCGAMLTELTRLRIGSYHIDDTITWNQLPEKMKEIIKN